MLSFQNLFFYEFEICCRVDDSGGEGLLEVEDGEGLLGLVVAFVVAFVEPTLVGFLELRLGCSACAEEQEQGKGGEVLHGAQCVYQP